jgi:hypothetical protein
VREFYEALERGELTDVSVQESELLPLSPSSKQQTPAPAPAPASASETTSTVVAADAEKKQETGQQYWESTSAGKFWFELCSELPGSAYLSATSAGTPYELQPTMRNVCSTVGTLLGARRGAVATAPPTDTARGGGRDTRTQGDTSTQWRLKDLEEFWNREVRVEPTRLRIATSEDMLHFRAPFSDTETIHRELGTISMIDSAGHNRFSIEIELEKSHQLATVKHKTGETAPKLWNAEAREIFADNWTKIVQSGVVALSAGRKSIDLFQRNSFFSVLQSACLGDSMMFTLRQQLHAVPSETMAHNSPQLDALIKQSLLSARWGEEQRGSTTSLSGENIGVVSATDASLTSANAKKQLQYSIAKTLCALELLGHVQDVSVQATGLCWMLREAPQECTVEELAAVLLPVLASSCQKHQSQHHQHQHQHQYGQRLSSPTQQRTSAAAGGDADAAVDEALERTILKKWGRSSDSTGALLVHVLRLVTAPTPAPSSTTVLPASVDVIEGNVSNEKHDTVQNDATGEVGGESRLTCKNNKKKTKTGATAHKSHNNQKKAAGPVSGGVDEKDTATQVGNAPALSLLNKLRLVRFRVWWWASSIKPVSTGSVLCRAKLN